MIGFEFATAARIVFGRGAAAQVPAAAAALGRRALLVTGGGSTAAAVERIAAGLEAEGVAAARHAVRGEPDVAAVEAGAEAARTAGCDLVVAVGGGSVIDAAKAVAGLVANGGELLDYLEVAGKGRPLALPALPVVAVPTTAGTGSEVTRNAVVSVPSAGVKASVRSPHLLPRLAAVDPDLTESMPPAVTASTGLDALTQLLEPLVSCRANAMSDLVAEAGLRRAAGALLAAWRDGSPRAREEMAFASLCGGLALANAGLGAVHGFAAVLGGRYPIPHGVCCAALLPHVLAANLDAVARRDAGHPALGRFARAAALVTGDPALEGAATDRVRGALVERVTSLCAELRVPSLGSFGVRGEDVPGIARQARKASSMRGNPVELEPGELEAALAAAL